MAIQNVLQTRVVDLANEGKLLNVALLSLSNAAASATEPVRKQEFEAAIAALTFDNVVESTETSLQAYVDTNGTQVSEGTLLYLPNAPERANRFVRRDPAVANSGTIDDFININAATNFVREDLTAVYAGADGIYLDDVNGKIGITEGSIVESLLQPNYAQSLAKKGTAATYTDLGLAETAIQALESEAATHAITLAYNVNWVDKGDGTYEAVIVTGGNFGTANVGVRVLKDNGDADGFLEHISTANIQIESNTTSVRLTTDSATIAAQNLSLHVTGTPAI